MWQTDRQRDVSREGKEGVENQFCHREPAAILQGKGPFHDWDVDLLSNTCQNRVQHGLRTNGDISRYKSLDLEEAKGRVWGEVRWVSLAVAEKSRNVTPEKKNKNAKFIAVRCKWRRRNIKKEKAKK